ncbi:MAG TPA: methionyl-tRNA formyltransferase [Candidatus Limnocylindrales bacterium]
MSAAGGNSPVRAVFFGSGGFAVPILDALIAVPGVSVVAVVSAPDRPVGRKAVVTPTPVTARARSLGLPVLQPARVRRPEAVAELTALAPDLVILADYGQLIPRVLLDLPPLGFLNLHPSALPRWRGAAPIPATILAGDTSSAVTLMVVTEEMDAGPIVASAPLEVRPDDTAVSLEDRAALVAGELLGRALPEWLEGRLVARPQPADGVTLTRPLRREDGRLDVTRTAVELERQVRAYQPWPGAFIESAKTGGGRLIVKKAHVEESRPGDERFLDGVGPESVPDVELQQSLFFPTSKGRLVLDVMQVAGGREMAAEDYVRGRPDLRSR